MVDTYSVINIEATIEVSRTIVVDPLEWLALPMSPEVEDMQLF